jgi:hypothetical protein
MFIYIHILSCYKLFLYYNLWLCVMFDICSGTISYSQYFCYCNKLELNSSIEIYHNSFICKWNKVITCRTASNPTKPFFFLLCQRLKTPLVLDIYFLWHSLTSTILLYNLCLCVMFDSLSCSLTSIPFLATSCSCTIICDYV